MPGAAAGTGQTRSDVVPPVTSVRDSSSHKPAPKQQQEQQLHKGRGKEHGSGSHLWRREWDHQVLSGQRFALEVSPCCTLKAKLLPVRTIAWASQAGAGQLLVDGLQDSHVHCLVVIQATWKRKDTEQAAARSCHQGDVVGQQPPPAAG